MCAAAAEPSHPVNLALQVFKADAVVRVNGVPLDRIEARNGSRSWSGTQYALLARNGDNKIEVEATITDAAGFVKLMAYKTFDDLMYDETLRRSGALTYTLHATDIPEWAWTKADAVGDGRSELLQAVAEYHQAFAKKDQARVEAIERPLYDDALKTGAVTQADIDEELKHRASALATATQRPLPAAADLVVESHLGGQLYTVADKEHKPPVRFERPGHPDQTADLGKFWSRIGGKWYVVKGSD